MKKVKLFSLVLAVVMLISSLSLTAFAAETQGADKFPDVNKTDWFYPTVDRLTLLGAIAGMPDGKFYPNQDITRAEFVKIVVSTTIGEQTAAASGHWAANYMTKAEEKNLLLSGEFPADTWDTPILRQEMAKIVSRAMEFVLGEDIIADTSEYTAQITDWDSTCTVCKPDIAQAYAKGIIAGMPDGGFQGTKLATRAEAATMIVRLIDEDYRLSVFSGIRFNAKTDVTDDGLMKIDKAEEFMLYVVKNMQFYKESGKYYVKVSYPEMPEGFEIALRIEGEFKSTAGFLLTTRPVMPDDTRKIPNTGSFTREIENMTSPSDISRLEVKIFVIKAGTTGSIDKNTQEGYMYFISTRPDRLGVIYEDGTKSTKYIEYDFSKLFKW